jgi:hypothetical protein
VVDEDAAHGLGGGGEEVGAVLPRQFARPDELEERLVHERGRLQRVADAFAAQEGLRRRAQLVVDERQQQLGALLGRLAVVEQQLLGRGARRGHAWIGPSRDYGSGGR